MAGQTNAERGRDARARLLAAARELIGEVGWTAVSTRVLAERADMRPGLVHYHFDSLQALLRQAALGEMRRTLDDTAALLATADGPTEGVTAMLSFLDRYSGGDPTSLLFIEAYLAATRDARLRERISELMAEFRGDLTASLTRSGHHSPEAAANLVLALLDGFVLHKGINPELSAAEIAPLVRAVTRPDTDGAPE
ncbi:AcrR family transcriptional regulator [Nocardiopsis mwathae]|uniref:AcrR family transcriptional regulator n=1 Tax=Nocardiopsis mwathae TaxID=1472723 RepID=A0A7X0D7R5_9ACTN|nr:TetR/AcrR family transcriptional regulator [Nocardiopsis mwathae]MBB6174902.1 AcrR family transcriptional regulator [Nocardiopsis mwathae]